MTLMHFVQPFLGLLSFNVFFLGKKFSVLHMYTTYRQLSHSFEGFRSKKTPVEDP